MLTHKQEVFMFELRRTKELLLGTPGMSIEDAKRIAQIEVRAEFMENTGAMLREVLR